MSILTTFADHLDAFPALTIQQRAEIFHAWDCAPDTRPEDPRTYLASEARPAWVRVRDIPLTGAIVGNVLVLTLAHYAATTVWPTKHDILTALSRAADAAKETA